MTISATVALDSTSPEGERLISFLISVHKYVLAEFNTHRKVSKSFRSSRAVPVTKLLEEVRRSPAEPVEWLKNKPGMQGGEPMTAGEIEIARNLWRDGAREAANRAARLARSELHKQWANRPLETYLFAHGIVTGTEWMNFFGLRLSKNAQPEMRVLAEAMWREYNESEPTLLKPGQWHLPLTDGKDCELVCSGDSMGEDELETLKRISVARCARSSYDSFETGKRSTIDEDLTLYTKLLSDRHMGPFEHQATPDIKLGWKGSDQWVRPKQHGNFTGWIQNRKLIPGEDVTPLPAEYARH